MSANRRTPSQATRELHTKVALPAHKRTTPPPVLSEDQKRLRRARHDYEDREIARREREAERIV